MALLLGVSSPAEAGRPTPEGVCAVFKPHTGDTTVISYTYFYEPGVVEIYRCAYNHHDGGATADHQLQIYRYSDGSWSKHNCWC